MTRNAAHILREVKHAIRSGGYAWPGAYPVFILMDDGEALSVSAARENWGEVVRATLHGHTPHRGGWGAQAVAVNWEDTELFCAHTGERIESAYGAD